MVRAEEVLQGLNPAQTMDLTFTFRRAGDVTVSVPVAAPASNVPQTSTFNFGESSEGTKPGDEAGGGTVETGSNG